MTFSHIIPIYCVTFRNFRYILAVDNGNSNLDEIVRSLSKEMWNGEIRNISREEAFLINGVDQYIYDLLTVSLFYLSKCTISLLGIQDSLMDLCIKQILKHLLTLLFVVINSTHYSTYPN